MPLLTAFLDTSVILSGLASATGGSRKILNAGAAGKIKLVTSGLVIKETLRHLSKLDINFTDLETTVASKTIRVLPSPPLSLISKFTQYTNDPDDAHIIAATAISDANFLITLDQKHLLTSEVKSILKPIKVFSPKQFINYLRSVPK